MVCRFFYRIRYSLILLCTAPLFCSCSMLLSNTFIEPTVDNLQKQTDLQLVCEGAPAYLLMIDSLISSDPDSRDLLRNGSQAYSGYIASMVECDSTKARVDTISEKARLYGTTLLSYLLPIAPDTKEDELEAALTRLQRHNVPNLFWGTFAWLSWIQVQQGAPAAMADLVTVEKIMERLLELDEGFQAGSTHLFFGAYYATRPPMFGGDPEKSQMHFDRALQLSERKSLIIQATYAETLARQLFDRKLHDSLLNEVLDFPLNSAPEYALSNQIAKRKAQRLLEEDYFAE